MNPCTRIFASLLVLVFCGSCRKDKILGPCTGNCEILHFTGKAFDPGAQKPLVNFPVKVEMIGRRNCLYCSPYLVASGATKADGTFDFTTKVDTSIVSSFSCTITVQGPANDIVYAEPQGPGITPYTNYNTMVRPLLIDSAGVAPYEEYDFFHPTLLTVHLHRTGAILRSEPFLELSFVLSSSSTAGWGLDETPSNADTALTLYTGANVFTRIDYGLYLTDSTTENLTDSIRCVPGANNTIDISYP